ncbi:MAG: 5-(carboxyamino)imidazole ribonucleotide synthase [Acidobacteria bacterium]|nr:MAG: 5-(carboxyamino)imidazole ribonucleotide synthase [Acidobacteriota bacterium]
MTLGILGGGQLGYMLALAGYPLGLHFRFLDPSPEAPVGRIAQRVTADYTDHAALEKFSSGLELVTYEFENVPVEAAKFLAERVPVYPPPAALEAAQDRLAEKTLFRTLSISTTEFLPVPKPGDLDVATRQFGLPAVLKTCRMGYDGKGQWILRTAEDIAKAKLELPKVPHILERFVPFARELSVLAVRSRNGETAFYPLVENHHRGGILRLSLAPAPSLAPPLQRAAEVIARRVLESLKYVGVLAIEFFEHEGRLLANEMAPRVHNSGHWTIEGAVTSQFENHLRAVLGLPLGSTAAAGHCAMINLIGDLPEPSEVLAVPDAHLHFYGKAPRPGRKLGHVTLRAASPERLALRLSELPAFFHRPDFCLDSAPVQSASHRA